MPDLANAIPLYGADEPASLPEQWSARDGDRCVRNVVSPAIIPIFPNPAMATGAAVIVMPGGGFRLLAIDHEGINTAQWLADHGIAAFVLKYRTIPTPREQVLGPGPGGPGGPQQDTDSKHPPSLPAEAADGLKDAWAALQLVRSRAAGWAVDPSRIGVLGFSAGAMLTLELGVGAQNAARPDYIGVIYGPLAARSVPADAPPMFAVLAADDQIMAPWGFDLIQNYSGANRPVEFHLYEKGGHAFGMRKQGTSSDMWIDGFYSWMKARGLLKSTAR